MVVKGAHFIHLHQRLSPNLLHLMLDHVAEVLCLGVLHQELLAGSFPLFLIFLHDFHLTSLVHLEHGGALIIIVVFLLLVIVHVILIMLLALILRLLLFRVHHL